MREKNRIDPKAYLRQIERCDKAINNKLQELARAKELATKVTTTLKPDAAFGGGNQDKLGDAIAKIIDLQNEINKDIDEYVDLKKEVTGVIDQVKDATQMAVLYKRYILHEKLEPISEELGFTLRNICYIHGRALRAVAEILSRESDGEADAAD